MNHPQWAVMILKHYDSRCTRDSYNRSCTAHLIARALLIAPTNGDLSLHLYSRNCIARKPGTAGTTLVTLAFWREAVCVRQIFVREVLDNPFLSAIQLRRCTLISRSSVSFFFSWRLVSLVKLIIFRFGLLRHNFAPTLHNLILPARVRY